MIVLIVITVLVFFAVLILWSIDNNVTACATNLKLLIDIAADLQRRTRP